MTTTTTTTAPTVTPASVPPLRGDVHGTYDGRYRLYGVEHLPWGALPAYRRGGPATVVRDGWNKSTSSLCRALSSPAVIAGDDGTHKLSLSYRGEPHPLNGTRWALESDADEAAYNVGATAYYVPERDAARYGLPTEEAAA